jgi:hypothetical protein
MPNGLKIVEIENGVQSFKSSMENLTRIPEKS